MEKNDKVKIDNHKNKTSNKESNNKITIGIICGFLGAVVLLVLLAPISPLNVWQLMGGNENDDSTQQAIDNVIDMYNEDGVEITEDDIEVNVVEDEEGNKDIEVIVKDEDKRNQQRNNTQSKLDDIISEVLNTPKPERDKDGNITDDSKKDIEDVIGTDPTDYFPTINELVTTANISNERVKEFINNSINYDPDYLEPYSQMLLDQRRTGSPAGSSAFPVDIYLDRSVSYSDMQERLNGQAFKYSVMPETIFLDDQKHFYPYYYSTYSPNLYSNMITKAYYNKTFDVNMEVNVSAYTDSIYTFYNQSDSDAHTYNSMLKLRAAGCEMIFGMRNSQMFLLDIV